MIVLPALSKPLKGPSLSNSENAACTKEPLTEGKKSRAFSQFILIFCKTSDHTTSILRDFVTWVELIFEGIFVLKNISPFIASISDGSSFEQLRMCVEVIPCVFADIIRESFRHASYGR